MDQDLHVLFERTLDGEPAPPGDLARDARARGRRLRRRRGMLVAGAAGGVIAVAAVTVALGTSAPRSCCAATGTSRRISPRSRSPGCTSRGAGSGAA